MDMKQILAAFDSAGSKPVTGTNDMKRFVCIIKENSQPQATFTPKVGDEILWRPRNAKMVPTLVTVLAVGAGKLEIKLQSPRMIQSRGGKDTMTIDLSASEIMPKPPKPAAGSSMSDQFKDIRNAEGELRKEFRDKILAAGGKLKWIGKGFWGPDAYVLNGKEIRWQGVQNAGTGRDMTEGPEEDLAAIEKHPAADDNRIQKAVADKKKELSTKEGIHNGLSFKDYFALEESKKKITAKEDPCWKGYKMVGTKKKGGREVPNCVPGKKGD